MSKDGWFDKLDNGFFFVLTFQFWIRDMKSEWPHPRLWKFFIKFRYFLKDGFPNDDNENDGEKSGWLCFEFFESALSSHLHCQLCLGSSTLSTFFRKVNSRDCTKCEHRNPAPMCCQRVFTSLFIKVLTFANPGWIKKLEASVDIHLLSPYLEYLMSGFAHLWTTMGCQE